MPYKVYENQEGLERNGTHQFLAYAVDVKSLDRNINIINENIKFLLKAT
jgi:hypothetical protein